MTFIGPIYSLAQHHKGNGMKFLFLALLISNSVFADFIMQPEFPMTPDAELTPGSLCDLPNDYRYPEKIPYCNRDALAVGIKEVVFQVYRNHGFILNPQSRIDYKIDHMVPLCAGGSNYENNLWPQHVSIYTLTDPLESLGCEKLRQGKIKQAELIKKITSAKKDHSLVTITLQFLKDL